MEWELHANGGLLPFTYYTKLVLRYPIVTMFKLGNNQPRTECHIIVGATGHSWLQSAASIVLHSSACL